MKFTRYFLRALSLSLLDFRLKFFHRQRGRTQGKFLAAETVHRNNLFGRKMRIFAIWHSIMVLLKYESTSYFLIVSHDDSKTDQFVLVNLFESFWDYLDVKKTLLCFEFLAEKAITFWKGSLRNGFFRLQNRVIFQPQDIF